MLKADVFQKAAYRHALYYLEQIRIANELYRSGGQNIGTAVTQFEEIWSQVQQGFDWANQHREDRKAAELISSLVEAGDALFDLRHTRTEYVHWLQAAVECAEALGQTYPLIRHLFHLGGVYLDIGNVGEGISICKQALALAERYGDVESQIRSLILLGNALIRQSDYEPARNYFQKALERIGDIPEFQRGKAVILNNMGAISSQQGQLEAAAGYYRQSMEIHVQAGNDPAVSGCLNNLGSVAWQQGDLAAAETYFQDSLAIRRKLGDIRGIINSLNNLGAVFAVQQDFETAKQYWKDSLTLAEENGIRQMIAFNLLNLGSASRWLKDYEAANDQYSEGIRILRDIGNRFGVGNALYNQGFLYIAQRRLEDAALVLSESIEIVESIGAKTTRKGILIAFGQLYTLQGDAIRGAELLGLVTATPVEAELQIEVNTLRDWILHTLSPEIYQEAVTRGALLNTEAVVSEILETCVQNQPT